MQNVSEMVLCYKKHIIVYINTKLSNLFRFTKYDKIHVHIWWSDSRWTHADQWH